MFFFLLNDASELLTGKLGNYTVTVAVAAAVAIRWQYCAQRGVSGCLCSAKCIEAKLKLMAPSAVDYGSIYIYWSFCFTKNF